MSTMTYLQIKTKVQNDLDLIDEQFITAAEMLGYCNEAIAKAESLVHGLYEDYFLASAYLPIVAATQTYSLPSDIYANKIRKMFYDNSPGALGGTKYTIRRVRKMEELPFLIQTGTVFYKYLLTNTAAAGPKIAFYPPPAETSTTNITLWYIRDAKRMTGDSDTCDIPEFVEYVIQYMKMRCYEKEGHPNLEVAKRDVATLEKDMQETLTNMVDDDDTEILLDWSFYQDFDSDDYFH